MKVAIALHAWRVFAANRLPLYAETLRSIEDAGYPYDLCLTTVGMPGADDGTHAQVLRDGGVVIARQNSAGAAMNESIGRALATGADLILYTADDFSYSPGWLARLVAFWQHAPADVVLACCHVEPNYSWATVRGVIEAGGQKALVRDTIPGSNWSFRAADRPLIGPVREATGNEDLEICRKLTAAGKRLVALPLAAHTGALRSSWGNMSANGVPEVDLRAWGLEP